MNLLLGWLVLMVLAAVDLAAFAGARAVASTRSARARGPVKAALGLDADAWIGASVGRKLLFVLAGPAACYLVASAAFLLGGHGEQVTDTTSMRVVVAPDRPAAEAGLRDGDAILTVGEVPVGDWDQLRGELAGHAGEPILVAVRRGDARVVLRVVPDANGKIGIAPPETRRSVPFGRSLLHALAAPAKVNAAALAGWFELLTGHVSGEVSGPIALSQETGKATANGKGAELAGAVGAYFLWIPLLAAVLLFPWRGASRELRGRKDV